jgi:hypothetical protein
LKQGENMDAQIFQFKDPDRWGPEFGTELAREIKDYMRRTIAPLEKRIAELEGRPQVKYQGVYRPGAEYSEGALVTRDGSIFHCSRTTRASPGDGSMDWQLAVKRGQDGKSAR